MVRSFSAGYQLGGSVLYGLQATEQFVRDAKKQNITIVLAMKAWTNVLVASSDKHRTTGRKLLSQLVVAAARKMCSFCLFVA